jgi:hypothetical protein
MSSDRNSGLEWGCVPVVLLIIVLWALILTGVVAVVR